MYHTNDWEILAPINELKTYSPSQIKFRQDRQIKRSPALDHYIDKIWEKELKKAEKDDTILTDGPLIRLSHLSIGNEDLTFGVSLTSYKEYKATCLPVYRKKFEEENGRKLTDDELACTFASATVPVTLDDYLVLFERTSKVSEFKGYLSIPSGGKWDGNPIETYQAMLRSSEELFDRCRRIVRNEFNHQVNTNNESHKLLSVYHSKEYVDSVLNFTVKLDNEAGELKERAYIITGSSNKYRDIELVKFQEGTLADFIKKNKHRIPSTILPSILMGGAHKFGEEWPLTIKGVKRLIEL